MREKVSETNQSELRAVFKSIKEDVSHEVNGTALPNDGSATLMTPSQIFRNFSFKMNPKHPLSLPVTNMPFLSHLDVAGGKEVGGFIRIN